MKPRFIPMARRWGWFIAGLMWLKCRLRGHEWHAVETYLQTTDEQGVSHGQAKVVCADCAAAKLVDLKVWFDHEGKLQATSTTGRVILLPKDPPCA